MNKCGYFSSLALASAALLVPSSVASQKMTSDGTYIGKIRSIAYGFYGQIGVALDGQACNGSSIVYLKKDNAEYDNIRAMILTAVSSGQIVKFARLGSYGLHANSCVIGEAAIGDWPAWN